MRLLFAYARPPRPPATQATVSVDRYGGREVTILLECREKEDLIIDLPRFSSIYSNNVATG
jgi:hypothetical protein